MRELNEFIDALTGLREFYDRHEWRKSDWAQDAAGKPVDRYDKSAVSYSLDGAFYGGPCGVPIILLFPL